MQVNQVKLAQLFRMSTRTIQRWESEGLKASRVEKGVVWYDMADAIAWRLKKGLAEGDPLREAQIRRMEAIAAQKEFELENQRGNFVPMHEVDRLLSGSLERVANALRAAPTKLAPTVAKRLGISRTAARVVLQDLVEEVKSVIRDRK